MATILPPLPQDAFDIGAPPAYIPELHHSYLSNAANPLAPIYEKVLRRERITREEAEMVYRSHDLLGIGMLADAARKLMTPIERHDEVYWVHNFHINPTNICEANCRFCSFKKGPGSPFAYVMSVEDVIQRVKDYPQHDTLSEFHIVSGLYDQQTTDYYVELFEALNKNFPHVHIKGMTAVEIAFMAEKDGITPEKVLQRLKAAGLKSLPGGGAEVFAERVREAVCVDKIPANEWLRIHGEAHKIGITSTATMLAGLGETPEERVDHMIRLREQQDKTGGFMTFIPLNCYYDNNAIDPSNALTGVENLKNFAVARLVLDNIPHIKAFWIHIGEKISQTGLHFGVDDLDGTVVQEKIAHSAGTEAEQHLTKDQLLNLIWTAGRTAIERDSQYNILKKYPIPEDKRGYHEAHTF